MADARNLAWKLAMVRAGQAGDRLLDSYHEERHAVAELASRQALLRWENPRPHRAPSAADARRPGRGRPVDGGRRGEPGRSAGVAHSAPLAERLGGIPPGPQRLPLRGTGRTRGGRLVRSGTEGGRLARHRSAYGTPDGFIGWRSRTGGDPTALDEVLTSITGTEHA
ncbi:FAD-dependent monooxygenase [Streptomyces sp. cg2]|uniref:FAD-dependent monooxygenase n=1 Tax=Streptomyces sp. cg2 TaxID=3238799 RepID=UPI0034E1D403